MAIPNVFISRRPRTLRGWLRLVIAYHLPIAILVVTSIIIFLFLLFFLQTHANGSALRTALQLAATTRRDLSNPTATAFVRSCEAIDQEVRTLLWALTCSLLPCCVLYVLLYWSFYRAVFTAPGFVDLDGVWRGIPRTDPHRQSQVHHNWLSAQQVLQQTYQQQVVFLAHQRAWRAYQRARFHEEPFTPDVVTLLNTPTDTSPAPCVASGTPEAPKETAVCSTSAKVVAENNSASTHIEAVDRPPSPFRDPRDTAETAVAQVARSSTGVLHDARDCSRGGVVQPPADAHNTHSVSEYEVNGAVRLCVHCQLYKPDHSHHCRHCGRCVSYMDHHCGFLTTCVGLRNYKFFLLLLFYTVCCGFGNGPWLVWLMLRARAICTHLRHLSMHHSAYATRAFPPSTTSLGTHLDAFARATGSTWWLSVPIAMFLIASVVMYLLLYHVELCWRGESTLERKTSASVEALMRLTNQAHGTASSCHTSCVCCPMLAALWQHIKRRLCGDKQGDPKDDSIHDDTEDRCPRGSHVGGSEADIAMAAQRRARLRVLFGSSQPWWYHLLPCLPTHLASAAWLAQQGIESPDVSFFRPHAE